MACAAASGCGGSRKLTDTMARRQVATETFNTVVEVIGDCQRAGLARTEEPAADLALTACSAFTASPSSSSTECWTGRSRTWPRW